MGPDAPPLALAFQVISGKTMPSRTSIMWLSRRLLDELKYSTLMLASTRVLLMSVASRYAVAVAPPVSSFASYSFAGCEM